MRFFFLRFFFSGFFSLSRSLFSHPTFFSLFSPLQKKKTFKKKKFRYIPKYTWKGLVRPMWSVIRAFTRAADLTLVPSATMKATLSGELERFFFFSSFFLFLFFFFLRVVQKLEKQKNLTFFLSLFKNKKTKNRRGVRAADRRVAPGGGHRVLQPEVRKERERRRREREREEEEE